MECKITATPSFNLSLDKKTVDTLIKLGKTHYDRDCKNAVAYGGFIYGWCNAVEFGATCTGTFRELDLTLKICEMKHCSTEDLTTCSVYEKFITKMLHASQELINLEFNYTGGN